MHRKVKNRELPLPYKANQKYVVDKIVPLGIDTRLKWHDFDKLPPNIPKHPQNVYKGEGYGLDEINGLLRISQLKALLLCFGA